MSAISRYLSKKKYQYELQSALYMLEPWEKVLFNSLALCLLSVSIATAYHFIMPFYSAAIISLS
ncbi:small subunit of serine palmitoyltransferase-like protein [Gilbertella persicaria]|uniref:small subunit of serine palmitoyltransferase-like protein n=1 Tax=Gilbertella persicaria TaxID=101096 RepID=UPI002220A34C|nr:small subunit of serine palmitoyltransferase-like protein [Gilbertella persicaria]KAI8075924.1 small subunit of serine palmitoyltransferase-like protein [Gilbertella persicaria]